MKPTDIFIEKVQKRVANVSIGASTMRGQGKGTVLACRKFLTKMNLCIDGSNSDEYSRILDKNTLALQRKIPNKSWGTARKAINIFLFDCLMNKYLSKAYGLDTVEKYMEVPLDRQVYNHIKSNILHISNPQSFPKWKGVKHLTKEDSNVMQDAAYKIAFDVFGKIPRVYLDLYFWREKK